MDCIHEVASRRLSPNLCGHSVKMQGYSKSWAEWVGVEVSGLMLIRVDGLGFRV